MDPAAAGGDLPVARVVPGAVAFCEPLRPAAHRPRRGTGRDPDSAGARHAEAAGGRAPQRSLLLSDRFDLPDGGLALRVPAVEGAPAVQSAIGTRRAGARRRLM